MDIVFLFGELSNWHSVAVSKAIEKASKNGKDADALINTNVKHSFWAALLFTSIAKDKPFL